MRRTILSRVSLLCYYSALPSFGDLSSKVTQWTFKSTASTNPFSRSHTIKSKMELGQPSCKERRAEKWRYKTIEFYWEESYSFLIRITHSDDNYSLVVWRMTRLLEEIHLQLDIMDYVEELWMPGPRFNAWTLLCCSDGPGRI